MKKLLYLALLGFASQFLLLLINTNNVEARELWGCDVNPSHVTSGEPASVTFRLRDDNPTRRAGFDIPIIVSLHNDDTNAGLGRVEVEVSYIETQNGFKVFEKTIPLNDSNTFTITDPANYIFIIHRAPPNYDPDYDIGSCRFTGAPPGETPPPTYEIPPDEEPPPGLCPSFAGFSVNGNQFSGTQDVGIGFNPVVEHVPNDYLVGLFKPGDEPGDDIATDTRRLVLFGDKWVANFGPLEPVAGSYNIYLAYTPNVTPPIEILCTELYFFVIGDAPGSGSGENPCIDVDGDGRADECVTALGTIPTDITTFAGKFLSIALGIAGGIALILLVIGSIRVLISSGNQQTLAAGRDMIIAATAGLLFLVFSVLILKFIGISILGGII